MTMYRDYKYRETYLLPIGDRTLQMIGDTRALAACTRTGCLFFVQDRICSRKFCDRVLRCCIFEVRGVSRVDISRFNRLMETYFPEYKRRREHDAGAVKARLAFTEWTPDNTSLFYMSQRFGLGRSAIADVNLTGPCGGVQEDWKSYHTSLMDMVQEIPRSTWMAGKRESDCMYTSTSGICTNFQPVLFRRANKNKTYKGKGQSLLATEPLPRMNYFTDPDYVDRLIDPLLTQTLRAKEAMLESERHSNKTMMPGYNKDEMKEKSEKMKSSGKTDTEDKAQQAK